MGRVAAIALGMLPILLLMACSSAPTVSAPSALHAQAVTTAGRPLLQLSPDGLTVDGAASSLDAVPVALEGRGAIALLSTTADVPWQQTHDLIQAMPDGIREVAFIVNDATVQPPEVTTHADVLDIAWVGEHYTLRTDVQQPMVSGGETRLLGTLSDAQTARILAGPDRSTWEVIAVADSAHGQQVSCVLADIEVADTASSDAPQVPTQMRVGREVSAVMVQRAVAPGCRGTLGRLPEVNLQSSENHAIRVDGGPLGRAEIVAALEPMRSTWEQCLGLARSQAPEVVADEPAKAIAEVDVGTDGTVLGTVVMVSGVRAQERDTQERCLARTLHDSSFDTQGQRARFLLTVMP